MIVEVLVVGQCAAGVGDGEFALVEVPELHAGTVVGSFHAAVELRAPWRQDVQWDVESLAGLLEVRPELAAAVDLDGQQGVGEVVSHGLKEAFGVVCGGAGVGSGHELLADGGDGLELLELFAVAGEGQVVELHQLAGLCVLFGRIASVGRGR